MTWTAAPDAGIPVDEFGVFRISVKLPDADTVSFPTTQTYADGAVVKWDQPPAPGGAEPEHPAPTLVLAGGPTPPAQPTRPDQVRRADRHRHADRPSSPRPCRR